MLLNSYLPTHFSLVLSAFQPSLAICRSIIFHECCLFHVSPSFNKFSPFFPLSSFFLSVFHVTLHTGDEHIIRPAAAGQHLRRLRPRYQGEAGGGGGGHPGRATLVTWHGVAGGRVQVQARQCLKDALPHLALSLQVFIHTYRKQNGGLLEG